MKKTEEGHEEYMEDEGEKDVDEGEGRMWRMGGW